MDKSRSLFVLVSLISLLFSSCHHSRKVLDISKRKEPKPFDYWYLVRSHPLHGFDKQAYNLAIQEVVSIKENQEHVRGPEHELDWRLEGPFNVGGKVDVITPIRRGSDTLFAGTSNGGIFRSLDGGQNWDAVFDDYGSMSIGSITVDPNNIDVIYAGTGDRNLSGGSFPGNGLYKSTDMGLSWSNIGLSQVGIITSCSVNPQNSLEIIVGAQGDPFQKTTERGVYRTIDGGQNWTNTLFVSDSSGVTEISRHPTNPLILYTSTYNRLTLPDHGISYGPDSRVYKSIDGGQNWTQLTNGLPLDEQSRVCVQVAESNPSTLYALFVGLDYNVQDIYVSTNSGSSWTGIGANGGLQGLDLNVLGGYGWYFGRIHVSPWDENHLILPGIDQYESFDGGMNWILNVPEWWTYEVHADKHELIFQDPNTIIIGTDGGIYKTSDGAASWQVLGRLPITQFYSVTANTFTNGVYAGGAQDNGTSSGNYLSTDWNRDYGGDGFKVTYISETEHSIIYETQNAGLTWVDDFNGAVDISTFESNTNWFTPYVYLANSMVLLAGSNRITKQVSPPFNLWEPITGDLTQIGLGTATTPERYHTITEIDVNPNDENQILTGTSDGLVWLGDLTGNMQNITGNLPSRFVTDLMFSKTQASCMYVTMSGYYENFHQAEIYKSSDNGQSWQSIAANLPAIGINSMVSLVVGSDEFLFIGTDGGVFVSINDGQSWDLLGQNLPVATVSSLDIDPLNKRLVAGTYGRSMWSYDITYWFSLVGQEELSLNKHIYPNPSSGSITFGEHTNHYTIFTLEGKQVLEGSNIQAGEKIDLKVIPAGEYLIDVDGKGGKLLVNGEK